MSCRDLKNQTPLNWRLKQLTWGMIDQPKVGCRNDRNGHVFFGLQVMNNGWLLVGSWVADWDEGMTKGFSLQWCSSCVDHVWLQDMTNHYVSSSWWNIVVSRIFMHILYTFIIYSTTVAVFLRITKTTHRGIVELSFPSLPASKATDATLLDWIPMGVHPFEKLCYWPWNIQKGNDWIPEIFSYKSRDQKKTMLS